jgi:hypothetical protein
MDNPKVAKREKPIDRWLAVGGIAAGILLFLAPKTPPVIISLLIIVFALLIHPIWHFWWIEAELWRKLASTILFVLALGWFGRISWPPESTGFWQTIAAPVLGMWQWLRSPHGRWLDEVIGAVYALLAVFLLLFIAGIVQALKKVRNRGDSKKGFLDYKLDAEMAMSRMTPMLEKLTRVMTEVGPALNRHTEVLLAASSTAEQVRVIRAAAASLDRYSRQVDRVRGQFVENGKLLSDGISGWFHWMSETRPPKDNLGIFPELLRRFTDTINTTNNELSHYIATTRATRGVSSVLDAAIDRHVDSWEAIAFTNRKIFEACNGALLVIDGLA